MQIYLYYVSHIEDTSTGNMRIHTHVCNVVFFFEDAERPQTTRYPGKVPVVLQPGLYLLKNVVMGCVSSCLRVLHLCVTVFTFPQNGTHRQIMTDPNNTENKMRGIQITYCITLYKYPV